MRDSRPTVSDEYAPPQATDLTAVRRIERAGLRAWPALHETHYDGWLLRWAEGYTKRANSVNPLQDGRLDLAHKVARCEGYYRTLRQRPIFRLTPLATPERLDALLAARGYAVLDPTNVLTLDLRYWHATGAGTGTFHEDALADWLAHYYAASGIPTATRGTHARMLARIATPVTGARIAIGGRAVACGIAVADGDLLGLFDIVTAHAHRRRGYARALIEGLLAWGRRQGATHAYLQVVAGNAPAQALYRSVGFRQFYRYWYRVPAEQPSGAQRA
jgi:GNAT superfamily N-acetyltransferase